MNQPDIKAIEYLNRDPLRNLATLKHLLLYKDSVEISIAEDTFDWALLVRLPTELLSYDSATYPDAKQAIFINGSSDPLKQVLLSKLSHNDYILRTNERLDLSILKNRFDITQGNSYVSYSCSSISSNSPPETIQESYVLTDEAEALISRNGYTRQELHKYFKNGSVWFGYIESGEIKSICFVYQNHDNIWEIAGVHTVEADRKKGFARLVVLAAVRYLLENGLIPRYEVDINNTTSINLAESLGMKQFLRIDHFLLKPF